MMRKSALRLLLPSALASRSRGSAHVGARWSPVCLVSARRFETSPPAGSGERPATAPAQSDSNRSAPEAAAPSEHPLADALNGIIRRDRMVVFLTGTPTNPRCRFTVATVDMLRQLGVKYSYFNILDDDEICEGLKEFSGWPTYPQIYIDGELIGGYDVCKKMLLDGDLTRLLKEKELL